MAEIYIGTSGWHYDDWTDLFYPPDIKGYYELRYHAQFFNTVENNSSFYRIAQESTYKTWGRMTPENYKFSIKVNKFITHEAKLELTPEVIEKLEHILSSMQVLQNRLGAILIQLPASFRYDLPKLETFLGYFCKVARSRQYAFDIAIEFRNKYWFSEAVYEVLARYNVALVAADSSRYPNTRQRTADVAYVRLHGPEKLFASSYSIEQLKDWADYIKSLLVDVKRVYVYFNNDFHGYALENAWELQRLLVLPHAPTNPLKSL